MANAKRKTGRTPKLTPEVQKLIVDAVAACTPRHFAAQRAGIAQSTLRSWFARGRREKKGEYLAFLAAIKKAEAEAIITRVARIAKAGQGGQIVEKTTKTVTVLSKDGKQTTTTISTEKHAHPQWVADAWMLERRCPEDFCLPRKRDLADLLKDVKKLEKQTDEVRRAVEKENQRDASKNRPPLPPGVRDPRDV
jgi:hypothetical protein